MHVSARALLRVLVLALLLAVVVVAAIGGYRYWQFTQTALNVGNTGVHIDIPRNSGLRRIVHILHKRGVASRPWYYWRVLALQKGVTRKLHAGEYAVPHGMTPPQLLQRMVAGDVVQHQFTLVDGHSFKQVRARLAKLPKLKHRLPDMDTDTLLRHLDIEGDNAEGRFLPETYNYVKGDSDLDLLRRAHRAMHARLQKEWGDRDPDVPLDSPYQALILASLVQKETARADERKRVAGVFARRLRQGMRLQTDPTVIYGLQDDYDGTLTRSDLTTDSPYNTYLHEGLPPTPIAMPGKAALHAALHPASGDALYFVARGDGSGRHVFSATLAEHNKAVACYQLDRCTD